MSTKIKHILLIFLYTPHFNVFVDAQYDQENSLVCLQIALDCGKIIGLLENIGKLVISCCIANYPQGQRLKTTNTWSECLSQECKSSLTERLWLKVSHEVAVWICVNYNGSNHQLARLLIHVAY